MIKIIDYINLFKIISYDIYKLLDNISEQVNLKLVKYYKNYRR